MSFNFTNPLTNDVLDVCTPEEVVDIARLANSTQLGASATALISWAAISTHHDVTFAGYRPLDEDDLGRCEGAYEKAPQWLAEPMREMLEIFRQEVAIATTQRVLVG